VAAEVKPVQKNTLGLLITALVLSVVVYWLEVGSAPVAKRLVFNFTAPQIQTITITTATQELAFQKQNQRWQMLRPETGLANEAAIAFLVDLLTGSQVERVLRVSSLDEYGLEAPFATIAVQLIDQKNYRLSLGKETFDRRLIYARRNGSTDEVILVSVNFRNAVQRELREWQGS